MEVKGPNFGQYDARHIQQVQREIARSVKPNVLRDLENQDLDEETFQRILSEDLVHLSPEAQALLKQLRKERRKKKGPLDQGQQDFMTLLGGLEELRRQVEEDNVREGLSQKEPEPGKPYVPPSITLSTHSPGAPTRRPRAGSVAHSSPQGFTKGGELARKMVASAPSAEARDKCARELEVFGSEVIATVKKFGVRIIVLERSKTLTELTIKNMLVVAPSERTFDGRPWSEVRGLYDPSRRLLVVGEELLGRRDRSTARHEFAHAYDDTYSTKNQRRLPLSVQLWNSFSPSRSGVVSDYAKTNPAEYFAESVEAFFQDGARDFLAKADPLMFDYLQRLFVA